LMNQPPINQAIDPEAGLGVDYQSARARGNQPARDIKPQSGSSEIKASLLGQSSREI